MVYEFWVTIFFTVIVSWFLKLVSHYILYTFHSRVQIGMIKGNFFSTNIFFEKMSYGKVNENENLGNFFRPTFFSKNFPMEKSMKMKIWETFFSTNIFFEKFSYGKVNENENFGNFFFDQHFFRKIFLWKSQWKMKIVIFRKKSTPGEDLQ